MNAKYIESQKQVIRAQERLITTQELVIEKGKIIEGHLQTQIDLLTDLVKLQSQRVI